MKRAIDTNISVGTGLQESIDMASRRAIERFARSWLKWYPETTEEQLRAAMIKRFLGELYTENAMGSAIGGGFIGAARFHDSDPAGCLLLPVIAPIMATIHLFAPSNPERTARRIEVVLDQLRCDLTWAPKDS